MGTRDSRATIAQLRQQLTEARVEIARLTTPNTGTARKFPWVDGWYIHYQPSPHRVDDRTTLASFMVQVRYRLSASTLEIECGERRQLLRARSYECREKRSLLHPNRGDALRALGELLAKTEGALYREIEEYSARLGTVQRLRREIMAALVPPGSNQPLQ